MHFNTDQLRDYRFGLLEAAEAADIAAHLERCAECRAELEQIQRQFAALDILKDQPAVSDQLVAEVLRAKAPRKIIPFPTALLVAAAACIAMVFAMVQLQGGSRPSERTAGVPPATKSRQDAGDTAKTLAELRAQKPFAPASNIELNVLPRRDDVQLTIYNAEDLTLVGFHLPNGGIGRVETRDEGYHFVGVA